MRRSRRRKEASSRGGEERCLTVKVTPSSPLGRRLGVVKAGLRVVAKGRGVLMRKVVVEALEDALKGARKVK